MTRTPTMAEIIRSAIDARLAEVHTMLPGRIESFDADTQKADVTPMLKRIQKADEGEIVEDIPVIPAVPVVFPRAGNGYKITFPVVAGDRCMLVFCERSIDNYQLRGGGEVSGATSRYEAEDPESFQMHDLSDPVAVLGWYPDTETISAVDADGMVIGKDGGAVIHIADDEINLYEKAAAEFVALAQKTFDEIKALRDAVDANVTTNNSHTHAVTSAPGTTGPPIPTMSPPPPVNSVAAEKVKAT